MEKLPTDPVVDKNKRTYVFLKANIVYSKNANSQIKRLVSSSYHYVQLNLTKFFTEFITKKIHFMEDMATDNRASISKTSLEEVFSRFLMIWKLLS